MRPLLRPRASYRRTSASRCPHRYPGASPSPRWAGAAGDARGAPPHPSRACGGRSRAPTMDPSASKSVLIWLAMISIVATLQLSALGSWLSAEAGARPLAGRLAHAFVGAESREPRAESLLQQP